MSIFSNYVSKLQTLYAGVTQWHAGETDVLLDLAFNKLMKYVSTVFWFILLSQLQYCLFLSASIVLAQLKRKTFMLNHRMYHIFLCNIAVIWVRLSIIFGLSYFVDNILFFCSSVIVGVHQHVHYYQVSITFFFNMQCIY